MLTDAYHNLAIKEERDMPELKTAITLVEIIIGVAVAMLFGDFLGARVGRVKLAVAMGVIILLAIIAFTVYAAVKLSTA